MNRTAQPARRIGVSNPSLIVLPSPMHPNGVQDPAIRVDGYLMDTTIDSSDDQFDDTANNRRVTVNDARVALLIGAKPEQYVRTDGEPATADVVLTLEHNPSTRTRRSDRWDPQDLSAQGSDPTRDYLPSLGAVITYNGWARTPGWAILNATASKTHVVVEVRRHQAVPDSRPLRPGESRILGTGKSIVVLRICRPGDRCTGRDVDGSPTHPDEPLTAQPATGDTPGWAHTFVVKVSPTAPLNVGRVTTTRRKTHSDLSTPLDRTTVMGADDFHFGSIAQARCVAVAYGAPFLARRPTADSVDTAWARARLLGWDDTDRIVGAVKSRDSLEANVTEVARRLNEEEGEDTADGLAARPVGIPRCQGWTHTDVMMTRLIRAAMIRHETNPEVLGIRIKPRLVARLVSGILPTTPTEGEAWVDETHWWAWIPGDLLAAVLDK